MFTRTHTLSQWTVGGAGNYVTLDTDWSSLDVKSFKGIGCEGGSFAPSGVLSIAKLQLSCPVVVAFGGRLGTDDGARFVLSGTGVWPQLAEGHVGRRREILTSCLARQAAPKFYWLMVPDGSGIQSIACTVVRTDVFGVAYGVEYPIFVLPLRVHDGATLTKAVLTFRVPTSRSTLPRQTPQMRVVRVDSAGNTVPLCSVAGGANADGFVSFPTPTSTDGWFEDGAPKTFTLTCDQNNVVDVSQYDYFLQVIEEANVLPGDDLTLVNYDGVTVRERKADVVRVYESQIALYDDPGGGASALDQVLVVGQQVDTFHGTPPPPLSAGPAENGLWSVHFTPVGTSNGFWQRLDNLDAPEDFTPLFFVLETTDYTVWECYTPSFPTDTISTGKTPGNGSSGALEYSPSWSPAIQFRHRTARGNVYHSVLCTFDDVVDMRPQ